jgi:hypothetical protein
MAVEAVAMVTATPNPLPTSKAQLWDLHILSRLAMVMVTVTVTDIPSTTS